ncbi:MAG TPA: hypothetical protein DEQ09_01270 [Bacteroidales bacterium]|nr:hypothetical protein [Bacteroidales bacterium]
MAALLSCNPEVNNDMTNQRIMVAEDIIYDVIIKIPNPDDPWEVEKLEGYQGNRMISELFNAVYTEKIKAYDYHTGKRMSPDEVRKAELQPGFDRNNLGKIQFTENWYYNTATMDIEKEIVSVVLGYENREIDGTLIGYMAAFRLNFE